MVSGRVVEFVGCWSFMLSTSEATSWWARETYFRSRGKSCVPEARCERHNSLKPRKTLLGMGCMHYFCIPTDYSRWSNVWLVKNVWVFFLFQYPTISTIFFINTQYRAFEFLHWLTDNWTPRLHGTRCSALAGLIILGILLFQC